MSFLDRLKREAEQQRLQAEAVARERDERDIRYKSQIEPQMKALTAYLEGLAATMLEVKPPISIAMAVQGYGDLTLVPFWDYKVEHERRHRGFTVSMSWTMRIDSERTPLVRADGVTRVKALMSIFRQYHLGGIKEEKRTPQGDLSCASFQARGYIKSRMEGQITAEDPVLRLMFENASWLGVSRRQVPWDQINDSLFDRIARFIVREDDSLFTEELPDALRQRLRKDQEPSGPAAVQAPSPAPAPAPASAAAPAARETMAPKPPPIVAPETPEFALPVAALESEVPGGFGQGMLAAPAPMTEGEVIEIDESKLGLSDFHEEDDAISAFSIGRVNPSQPSKPAPALSAAPAVAPPLARQDSQGVDQSQRVAPSASAAPATASPAASAVPAAVPARPQTASAAPTQTVNPHAAAAAHAAMLAQRAAAARAADQATAGRAAVTSGAPSPPAVVAAGSSTTAAATASPMAPALTPAAGNAATAAEGEALDPVKEREAALFRLRMRAMMARLRTDESDEPKT